MQKRWHMHRITRSVSELLARVVRLFTGEPAANHPAIRWAEMKSVDFQGEDTSLTQADLALMR